MSDAISSLAFLVALRYGKISTSWLIINLSSAVPAIASALIYHETVNARKIAGLLLAVTALLLLYKDKKIDELSQASPLSNENRDYAQGKD